MSNLNPKINSEKISPANLQKLIQDEAQYILLDPVFPYVVIEVPWDTLNLTVDIQPFVE
jgi:hypothetical protein